MTPQTALDVLQPNPAPASIFKLLLAHTRACVAHPDLERVVEHGLISIGPRQSRQHDDFTTRAARRDAMLDGVFYQWLNQQGWDADLAQRGRHINQHPQPLLKTRLLDVEVRLDEFDLCAKCGKLSVAVPE